MRLRHPVSRSIAAAALCAAALTGAAACSDSDSGASSSSSAAGTTSASSSASAAESSVASAPADLDTAKAQQILRTVIDPNSTPETVAGLVDDNDPGIGQKLNGFAKGASQGGYTPDKFTVKSVEATDENNATVTVEVASPHAPQPVAVPYTFTKVEGAWKVSKDAVNSLLSMANGPH
ncbi:hypothetical protein [Williamsia sterculiae]|uniref:Low molecular weight antigen MTB12-like C-terminal domain-containing protein n=1 Tax=Williamsia sterculiae TaxID=1344003 RepID=A0A1N7GRH4_9NOCA|nr:hypothetical protein [Williamsia sterculiae]SIS15191.1 hypothetical protein SAMN05445060_3033 [Williamsia sterculiae]